MIGPWESSAKARSIPSETDTGVREYTIMSNHRRVAPKCQTVFPTSIRVADRLIRRRSADK